MLKLSIVVGWGRVLLYVVALGLFIQLAGLVFNNDGSKYATQLNIILFLPALLLAVFVPCGKTFWSQSSMIVLLCLFVWVLFSCMLGEGSLGVIFKNIFYLVLYFICLTMLIRDGVLFNRALLCSALFVSMAAWLTLYHQFAVLGHSFNYSDSRWYRLYSLGWEGFADLGHPIYAGLYYGVFSIIMVWLFLEHKLNVVKFCAFSFLIFGLLCYVLYTFSRGAWFSTCASGLIMLLLYWSEYKSRALMFFAISVLFIGLFVFWPEFINEQKIGVSGRQLIWSAWFDRLPHFWLWGSGASSIFDFTLPNGYRVNQAHSLYLQFWYEYGVVGFSLLIILLISLLRKGWRCRDQALARLGISLLVFAMVAMVSEVHSIIMRPNPYWVVVWFPIGILLGLKPTKIDSDKQSMAT